MSINYGNQTMMRQLKFAILILSMLTCAGSAFAQPKSRILVQPTPAQNSSGNKRIALVIGNIYQGEVRLKNPANDALDMAEVLNRLEFQLVGGKAHIDVTHRQMEDLINEFSEKLKGGGIGLFYFAGHGVQIDRVNYLIPFDSAEKISSISDIEYFGIQVDWISKKMNEFNGQLNILIFDACRNNPWRGFFGRAGGTDGLTPPSSIATGTFLAFAASDGQTASDNPQGRNGLYTQELLKNLRTPGLRLEDVFINTRIAVEELSKGRQTPDERSKLKGIFYFSPSYPYTTTSSTEDTLSKLTALSEANLSSTISMPYLENGKYGFKAVNGNVAVNPKYDYAGYFSGDLAVVSLNNKWGYIDRSGNEAIPLKYDYADNFCGSISAPCSDSRWKGTAKVKLNGKTGLIDTKGNILIPFEYDEVWGFNEGVVLVKVKGKYGFINESGRQIIPLIYDEASNSGKGKFRVRLNKKYGFIDASGKALIPIIYDDIGYYNLFNIGDRDFSNNLLYAKLNGKYGFLDGNGKEVIPFKFSDARMFREGLALVKLSGKYGYINEKGDAAIPFIYNEADSFINGLAQVKLNGKYGFIDKTGKVVVPIKYDRISSSGFRNGLVLVEHNGRTLYVTRTGVEITP